MDLDLRKLRYFAAVAEHRHFGRAAEQLYIAQPVLSRQIRALERELGYTLLPRTARSVELTLAGVQLSGDVPELLEAAAATARRANEVARGVARLVVGFAPGLHISGVVTAFAAAHPEVEVDVTSLNWYEQAEAILDGRADVGYLRGSFDDPALDVVPVGTESKVLCLPADHRLAARRRLTLADIEGETMLNTDTRGGMSVEEKLERVAAGHGLILSPRSVARFYARPGLVYRPVTDAPPFELSLATVAGRRLELLDAFVELAAATLSTR